MLHCHDISCAYNGNTLLRGLNICCDAKQLTTLIGANGIGKSTLLKTMAGLQRPFAGEVRFYDQNIAEDMSAYWYQLHYISHKHALDPALTVRQQLVLWGKLFDTAPLVDAASHFMRLQSLEDCIIQQLSEGWKKRLSYARLLISPKMLWVLDEPFAFLDDEGRGLILSLIATRCDQGGTVIISNNQDVELPFGCTVDLQDYAVI